MMTVYRIEERLTPRDLPDFEARWKTYLRDLRDPETVTSIANPLDDFVPDQWRFREEYDDAPVTTVPEAQTYTPPSVEDYMAGIKAREGRECRVAGS